MIILSKFFPTKYAQPPTHYIIYFDTLSLSFLSLHKVSPPPTLALIHIRYHLMMRDRLILSNTKIKSLFDKVYLDTDDGFRKFLYAVATGFKYFRSIKILYSFSFYWFIISIWSFLCMPLGQALYIQAYSPLTLKSFSSPHVYRRLVRYFILDGCIFSSKPTPQKKHYIIAFFAT